MTLAVILLPSNGSSKLYQQNSPSKISTHYITSLVLKCFPPPQVCFSHSTNIFVNSWFAPAWTVLKRLALLSLPQAPLFSMMVHLLQMPLNIEVSLGHCSTLILLAQTFLSQSTSYLSSCITLLNPTRVPLNVCCDILKAPSFMAYIFADIVILPYMRFLTLIGLGI